MDAKNELKLSGTIFEKPALSHMSGPYAIYSLKLCVERLSGNCDLLNVLAPEHVIKGKTKKVLLILMKRRPLVLLRLIPLTRIQL